ncbi:50S ribosomal protein L5 [Candidatus Peregrinibacteria bacterium]|nr:50S ribosomal protein L5 [Candidatus Peregrinibacteria bacterium]
MSFSHHFKTTVIPQLQKEFNLKNSMAVPRILMVKVSVGIGSFMRNSKDFSEIVENLAKITGQKAVVTKSRKAISNFKLREGVPVGLMITLRGGKMFDFLDRLIHVVLPRVRDFQGLSKRSFDGHGNYSIGMKEALVFPEINPDNIMNVHGVQVTVVTTAGTNEKGLALLKACGFPFKKD